MVGQVCPGLEARWGVGVKVQGGTEAGLGLEAGVVGCDANSVGWGLEMPGEWCVPSLGHSGVAQGVACQEAELP